MTHQDLIESSLQILKDQGVTKYSLDVLEAKCTRGLVEGEQHVTTDYTQRWNNGIISTEFSKNHEASGATILDAAPLYSDAYNNLLIAVAADQAKLPDYYPEPGKIS